MADEITPPPPEEGARETPAPTPSGAGLGSSPGTAQAPVSEPRASMLYNTDSGKLDVKKLATWIAAIAGFIASVSFVGTHLTDWTRWWLDLDDTATRLTACETRLDEIEGSVPVQWRRDQDPPRDPNARLAEAIPSITQHFRDAQKERRRHNQAIVNLTTIHEFGLRGARERDVAHGVRNDVRDRAEDPPAAGVSTTTSATRASRPSRADPLSDLAAM